MTLTLHLPPELEQRLTEEAQWQGLSLNDYAVVLLSKSLLPPELISLRLWFPKG